ncbi:MAG: GGDEF domain-containing protein [Actinomycetota bacterium]|nr:GGDEF domain-containing protein [Actinomycetota bacterium]
MIGIQAGLLLPQSTLSQPWFLVFALVVGFNTLIYLGLTVSKLVPWPPQIHPSRVRAILPFASAQEPAVTRKTRASLHELHEPFVQLRHDAARQTIPQAMVLIGALMLVIALLNLLAYDEPSPRNSIGAMVTAFVLIATSQVLVRTSISASGIIAVWTVMITVVIIEVSYFAAVRNEPVVLVNAVVLLVMLPPMSMSWRAGLVGGALSATAVLVSGSVIDSLATLPWVVASLAALVAGLVLLQIRMTIIDRLSLSQMRANALASTDPLTGLFSRTGLLALAETIASTAAANGQQVHVLLCDIRGLDAINRAYGIEFGDEVVQVTGRAVKATLPAADLVSRWDGNSFLTLGVGAIGDPAELRAQIEQAIARSGVMLGKRAIAVTLGSAVASPGQSTFEELVETATQEITAHRAALSQPVDPE